MWLDSNNWLIKKNSIRDNKQQKNRNPRACQTRFPSSNPGLGCWWWVCACASLVSWYSAVSMFSGWKRNSDPNRIIGHNLEYQKTAQNNFLQQNHLNFVHKKHDTKKEEDSKHQKKCWILFLLIKQLTLYVINRIFHLHN